MILMFVMMFYTSIMWFLLFIAIASIGFVVQKILFGINDFNRGW
jgi:hypothetical protein